MKKAKRSKPKKLFRFNGKNKNKKLGSIPEFSIFRCKATTTPRGDRQLEFLVGLGRQQRSG